MLNRNRLLDLVCIAAFVLTPSGPLQAQGNSGEHYGPPGEQAVTPSIISAHDGSGYYLFAGTKGIGIWHSEDLVNWKAAGRVFDEDVPSWARKVIPAIDVWAPDIDYAAGMYYLYYCVSTVGSLRSVIGLATNSTLDRSDPVYRWIDRRLVIESFPGRDNFNAIDPALFVDDDRRAYLFWGSFWTGIKATEIDLTTGKPASSPPKIIPIARRRNRGPAAIEAPCVIKHQNAYYLFTSWDFDNPVHLKNSTLKRTYKIMVGRSDSPLGPYVDSAGKQLSRGAGTLLLMGDSRWQGPGHNCVLQTPSGDWLAYHVFDANNPDEGRLLQLRPLKWEMGWPVLGYPLHVRTTQSSSMQLIGRWIHSVDNQNPTDIFLEGNGQISGILGEANWQLSGRNLVLKWINPSAPSGAWIDRVTVGKDRRSYQGRNQNGSLIRGVMIQPAPRGRFRRQTPGV